MVSAFTIKLTEPMRCMLEAAFDYGDPHRRVGDDGRSRHGGSLGTMLALIRRKLLTPHHHITPLGRGVVRRLRGAEGRERGKSKPTRRDLLIAIHKLQGIIDEAHTAHGNDRNPHGFQEGQEALERGQKLCHHILAKDPPMDGKRSKWVP